MTDREQNDALTVLKHEQERNSGCIHIDTSMSLGIRVRVIVNMSLHVFQWIAVHIDMSLWSLEERRHRADLLEFFRMYKGLSLTPFCRYFTLSPVSNTRGHSAKVRKNRCSLDLRRFFFSERVVD